ncbi:MAG: FAD-dependent oxidoreductase, partial [Janthinobacterium lividum]
MSTVKQNNWDQQTDLLVIGAGAGGMGAALVGKLEGMDVLVCERGTQVGGTAATSAGTVWIPGNRQSREAGYTESREGARTYLETLIGQPIKNTPLQ